MNKHFSFFIIIILFNYCINIYAKNQLYIVALLRKNTDKNYDDETPSNQRRIDKFVNDKMNDIYEIIEENKESYLLENGEMDKKLDELNSNQLKKRNTKNQKIFFPNERRSNKSVINSTSKDSFIEYIPLKSNIVKHLCPVSNYIVITVYLSDIAKEKICNLNNVLYCDEVHQEKEDEISSNENEYENENENENENPFINVNKNKKSSMGNYYDLDAIKMETNWTDVSIQEFNFKGFPNYLTLLSKSPNLKSNLNTDENFYYPSSAGKGIDIYLIDNGLIVNHEDYDTYEGTPDERTVTCDVVIENRKVTVSTTEEQLKHCAVNRKDYPTHGNTVTSIAGGKLLGVAKKANLHMIAAETKEEDTIDALDYVLHYGKRYKSVISLSRGGFYYSGTTEKKIHDLVERGFIIIVSAGNDNKDACGKKGSKQFRSYTGYKDTIAVGAVQSTISNNKYTGAYYSNYGECIDIFGPGSVMTPNVGHYDVDYKKKQGTSFSTPMVAGVVATIMSEFSEIKFDQELMRKTLIEMSLKNLIIDLLGEKTPNRFVNNGNTLNFSPDCTDGDISKCLITPIKTTKSDTKLVYLRSKYRNGCLYVNKNNLNNIMYSDTCNTKNSYYLWEIPKSGSGIWRNVGSNTYISYKNNNFSLISNIHSASYMGDITESSIGESIWYDEPGYENQCSYINSNQLYLQSCDESNIDQFWIASETVAKRTDQVWIKNKRTKQCLVPNTTKGLSPTMEDCINNTKHQWEISVEGIGFYKHGNLCLTISDDNSNSMVMGECNLNAMIDYIYNTESGSAITPIVFNNKCLNLNSDNTLSMKTCTYKGNDESWEILPKTLSE